MGVQFNINICLLLTNYHVRTYAECYQIQENKTFDNFICNEYTTQSNLNWKI